MTLARSLDREQAGALPEALAALTDAFDGDTEEIEEIEVLLADAVRLATETGDLSLAQELTGRAEALAAESEIPHRQANALYCRGLLDHDGARLLTAAERYEQAGRPLPRAKALEAAAGYFVDADDRTQARAAFTTAVEVYNSLGAAADAARLQAEFRAHGIRRGPHAKHRRAQSGWDSLTATEIKIAAFVEEGLSNPEIAARLLLSRRTVATHVSHILKKLNVNSRIDIARESALRTIPPGDAAGSEATRPGKRYPLEPRGRGAGFQGNSVGTVRRRGNDSQSPRLSASVAGRIRLEREREVHGFARRGAVDAPGGRQGGDQHQAPAGLGVGWRVHQHRQGARRVVDIDAQLAERAGDGQRDARARLVADGIGDQLAGEQDRDVRVDRDVPDPDGRADLAARFGRRSRAGGQPDAADLQLGGAGRRHRVHRNPYR